LLNLIWLPHANMLLRNDNIPGIPALQIGCELASPSQFACRES